MPAEAHEQQLGRPRELHLQPALGQLRRPGRPRRAGPRPSGPTRTRARYCTYIEGCYTSHGHPRRRAARPATRPHQLKLNGSYTFPFGLTIGGFFQAKSGTPVSRVARRERLGLNLSRGPADRRADGHASRSSTCYLQWGFNLDESTRATLTANVLNVFDQDAAHHVMEPTAAGRVGRRSRCRRTSTSQATTTRRRSTPRGGPRSAVSAWTTCSSSRARCGWASGSTSSDSSSVTQAAAGSARRRLSLCGGQIARNAMHLAPRDARPYLSASRPLNTLQPETPYRLPAS